MGWVGSKKTGILAGQVGLGWVTIFVGRVGSQNLDPRATLTRHHGNIGRNSLHLMHSMRPYKHSADISGIHYLLCFIS